MTQSHHLVHSLSMVSITTRNKKNVLVLLLCQNKQKNINTSNSNGCLIGCLSFCWVILNKWLNISIRGRRSESQNGSKWSRHLLRLLHAEDRVCSGKHTHTLSSRHAPWCTHMHASSSLSPRTHTHPEVLCSVAPCSPTDWTSSAMTPPAGITPNPSSCTEVGQLQVLLTHTHTHTYTYTHAPPHTWLLSFSVSIQKCI